MARGLVAGVVLITLSILIIGPIRNRPAGASDRTQPVVVSTPKAVVVPDPIETYVPVSRVEDAQARLDPYVTAAIRAQFVNLCGLEDSNWAGQVATDSRLVFQNTIARFTPSERQQMVKWQNELADRMTAAVPTSRINVTYCHQLQDAGIPGDVSRRAIEMERMLR